MLSDVDLVSWYCNSLWTDKRGAVPIVKPAVATESCEWAWFLPLRCMWLVGEDPQLKKVSLDVRESLSAKYCSRISSLRVECWGLGPCHWVPLHIVVEYRLSVDTNGVFKVPFQHNRVLKPFRLESPRK